jgi:hypothetical protein
MNSLTREDLGNEFRSDKRHREFGVALLSGGRRLCEKQLAVHDIKDKASILSMELFLETRFYPLTHCSL